MESSPLVWGLNLPSQAALSPTPTRSTWSPTHRLVSPPPLLHNLTVRPSLPGPSTWLPAGPQYPPCPLWRASRKPWVCVEGLGWSTGNAETATKAYTTSLLLMLSYTRSAGLAPWQVVPDWTLLNCPFARRGSCPGRIPCAEGGRAESGSRGCGSAGVQGTHTGLAEWRAGGPLWPLPRAPSAGEAGLGIRLGACLSVPPGTESPLPRALISRRSRRLCAARGRCRHHAVRAKEVSTVPVGGWAEPDLSGR